jgi:enterochelin esterase-like enzyme
VGSVLKPVLSFNTEFIIFISMFYDLKMFNFEAFTVESEALKKNPLGDPSLKRNVLLVPTSVVPPKNGYSLIYVLAGLTGNGPYYVNEKFGQENMVQTLDRCVKKKAAPNAIYVLVDAMTKWGGSQFLNSEGCGRYQDYIVKELHPQLMSRFDINPQKVAVIGGSSGGYGALHLCSKYPDKFPHCGAIAPDCAFDVSLAPELLRATMVISKRGGLEAMINSHHKGELVGSRGWHDFINTIGMAYCYSPMRRSSKGVLPEWPVDFETGEIINEVWREWLKKDPCVFLKRRKERVKRLKSIFVEVGKSDQFLLQFGARRIHKTFREEGISHHYGEFKGDHFDIGKNRPTLYKYLLSKGL